MVKKMVDLLAVVTFMTMGLAIPTLYPIRFVKGLSGLFFLIIGLFIFSEGITFLSVDVTVLQTIPNFAIGSFTILMGLLVLLGNMTGSNENTPEKTTR